MAEKILPKGEIHDIYVIIEASFYGVVFLFTWDTDILDADHKEVNRLLVNYDLNPVAIRHPSVILDQ